jgi:hypothetical protein
MDTDKAIRIQPSVQRGQTLTHPMTFATCVQDNMVTGCLNPIHLGNGQQLNGTVPSHGDLLERSIATAIPIRWRSIPFIFGFLRSGRGRQ